MTSTVARRNSQARSPYKWKFAKSSAQSNPKHFATGPRTEAGKAIVSQNAVKHEQPSTRAAGAEGVRGSGEVLFSTNPVLPGVETEEDWQQYRASLLQDLAPQGSLELVLAERAASIQWRLRRIPSYEADSTKVAAHQAELDISLLQMHLPEEARTHLIQLARSFPPPDVLDRVQRYEAHLTRQYTATVHQLQGLQSRRRAEHNEDTIPSFDTRTAKQTLEPAEPPHLISPLRGGVGLPESPRLAETAKQTPDPNQAPAPHHPTQLGSPRPGAPNQSTPGAPKPPDPGAPNQSSPYLITPDPKSNQHSPASTFTYAEPPPGWS